VIVSCGCEWQAVTGLFSDAEKERTPFGEMLQPVRFPSEVVFMEGGRGKVSAAASAQYAIDRWRPRLLVNLGAGVGQAYNGAVDIYVSGAQRVMRDLIAHLPAWIELARPAAGAGA